MIKKKKKKKLTITNRNNSEKIVMTMINSETGIKRLLGKSNKGDSQNCSRGHMHFLLKIR